MPAQLVHRGFRVVVARTQTIAAAAAAVARAESNATRAKGGPIGRSDRKCPMSV